MNDTTPGRVFAKASELARGCPTRQAGPARDRGLGPRASTELPVLSQALRASLRAQVSFQAVAGVPALLPFPA